MTTKPIKFDKYIGLEVILLLPNGRGIIGKCIGCDEKFIATDEAVYSWAYIMGISMKPEDKKIIADPAAIAQANAALGLIPGGKGN